MKNLIYLLLLLTLNNYSQKKFTFQTCGNILENGIKISPEQVREILSNNQTALNLYNAGRCKKTLGNILLYGGIGAFGIYSYQYIKAGSQENGIKDYSLLIAGVAAMLVSIPIKIGFSNKIRQAIDLMNQDALNPKTTYIESTGVVANRNGVGFSIKF